MAILQIPITKAGKDVFLTVDTETDLTDDGIFKRILEEGLKVLLNAGMTKITGMAKMEGKDLDEAHASALVIANKNLEAIKTGTLKAKRAKASATPEGVDKDVFTEARRIARDVVRNVMRVNKIRQADVSAAEITKWADTLIADDSTYFDKARANLAARADIKPTADLSTLIKADPARVAKNAAAAEAKKKDKPLSAKQAGIPKTRGKPINVAGQHAVH